MLDGLRMNIVLQILQRPIILELFQEKAFASYWKMQLFTESLWKKPTLRTEFGIENEGKLAVIVRSLYVGCCKCIILPFVYCYSPFDSRSCLYWYHLWNTDDVLTFGIAMRRKFGGSASCFCIFEEVYEFGDGFWSDNSWGWYGYLPGARLEFLCLLISRRIIERVIATQHVGSTGTTICSESLRGCRQWRGVRDKTVTKWVHFF